MNANEIEIRSLAVVVTFRVGTQIFHKPVIFVVGDGAIRRRPLVYNIDDDAVSFPSFNEAERVAERYNAPPSEDCIVRRRWDTIIGDWQEFRNR